MSWYTNAKFWSFVGGAAAAVVASAVSKQPATRKAAVAVVAKGMELQQSASASLQSLKEDAEDLAAEAREKAKAEEAEDDRRAAIEARVRAEVERQLAEEQVEEALAQEAQTAEAAPAPAKPAAKPATRARAAKKTK